MFCLPRLRKFTLRYPKFPDDARAAEFTSWLLYLLGDCTGLEDLYIVPKSTRQSGRRLPLGEIFQRMRWPRLKRLSLGCCEIGVDNSLREFIMAHPNLEYLYIRFDSQQVPALDWTDGFQNLKALYIVQEGTYKPLRSSRDISKPSMSKIEYLATFELYEPDRGDDVGSLSRMRFLRYLHIRCNHPPDWLLTRFAEAIPMIEWLSCNDTSSPPIVSGSHAKQADVCTFRWSRYSGSNDLCRESYHIESTLLPNSVA